MRPLDLLIQLAKDSGYAIGNEKSKIGLWRDAWQGVRLLLPATDFMIYVNSNADVWVGKHDKSSGTFSCNLHDPESTLKLKRLFEGIRDIYEDEPPVRVLCDVEDGEPGI